MTTFLSIAQYGGVGATRMLSCTIPWDDFAHEPGQVSIYVGSTLIETFIMHGPPKITQDISGLNKLWSNELAPVYEYASIKHRLPDRVSVELNIMTMLVNSQVVLSSLSGEAKIVVDEGSPIIIPMLDAKYQTSVKKIWQVLP